MGRRQPSQPRRLVIAMGGHAIIPAGYEGTYREQLELTRHTMDQVAELAVAGHEIVLTHGNGPVVGNIVLRNEAGWQLHSIPAMPLYICGADSQGGIGFMIQQSMQNALLARRLPRQVIALVTQVVVAEDDCAFQQPTKPIGPFYTEAQAKRLSREKGWQIVEDARRGWRRVVPSPLPLEVVEGETIAALVREGVITIAAGGGGIPVVRDRQGELRGCDAVIDKDRAAALLGRVVAADTLIIVTSVDRVYQGYGSEGAVALPQLDTDEASRLLAAGEFPSGSMGPKIEAALAFLAGGGREVVITDAVSLSAAMLGRAGTRIVPAA
jgi:carbamate kinase